MFSAKLRITRHSYRLGQAKNVVRIFAVWPNDWIDSIYEMFRIKMRKHTEFRSEGDYVNHTQNFLYNAIMKLFKLFEDRKTPNVISFAESEI